MALEEKIAEVAEASQDKNNPYVQIYRNKAEHLLRLYQQSQQEKAKLNLQLEETLGMVETPPEIPEWVEEKSDTSQNIPVLMVSDFHYGENVNPNEVPDGNIAGNRCCGKGNGRG